MSRSRDIFILLVWLLVFFNGCFIFKKQENRSVKVQEISDRLALKGYRKASKAILSNPTRFHDEEKELVCYIDEDQALVEELLAIRSEIEKIATDVFKENIKFKIIHNKNNRYEKF